MRKLFLLLLFCLVALAALPANAQLAPGPNRANFEVDCPSGYFPNPGTHTGLDTATALYVQAVCISSDGSFWCYSKATNTYSQCAGGGSQASTTIVTDITTITCSAVGLSFYSSSDNNFYICLTVGGGPVKASGNCALSPVTAEYVCMGPYAPTGSKVGVIQWNECYTLVTSGSSTPLSCSLKNPITKGDVLFAEVTGDGGGGLNCPSGGGTTAFTDSQGNSFNACFQTAPNSNLTGAISTAVTKAGLDTISVSFFTAPGATRAFWFMVFELTSNAAGVDVHGDNTTASNTVTVTSTHANDLAILTANNVINDSVDHFSYISTLSSTYTGTEQILNEADTVGQIQALIAGTGAATSYSYGAIYSNSFGSLQTAVLIFSSGALPTGPASFKPAIYSTLSRAIVPGGSPILPAVVFNTLAFSPTNASIAATTMFTANITSSFLFGAFAEQAAAGSGCTGSTTIAVNVIYTNQFSTNTKSIGTFTITGNGSAGTSFEGSPVTFLSQFGTNVQYSTTVTPDATCSTKPTYNLYPFLEEVQ